MSLMKRTSAGDADFQSLVVELDKELWLRYPETQQNFAPHNTLDSTFRVIVFYKNDIPAGCGCFRPMKDPDTVEIKRMYVVPAVRGLGIGKSILSALEVWAMEEGFTQSKLETGLNQPEAIAVYQQLGYKPIPNYPPYEHMSDSICMAKFLSV